MTQQNYMIQTLDKMRPEIESQMPSIVDDKDKYFKNTIIAIKRNPDLLSYTFNQNSCVKLITEVEKLARVGIQIGGIHPQAYIVPMKGSPVAIPTATGYKFVVTSGKHALFKHIDVFPIYKGDTFDLNEADGVFSKHETSGDTFDRKDDEFVGFVIVAEMTDEFENKKIARKVTRSTIETVRSHSPVFNAYVNKKIPKYKCTWETDFMSMAEKAAVKKFLKPYVSMCEGLAELDEMDQSDNENHEDIESKVNSIDVNAYSEGTIIDVEPEKKNDEVTQSDIEDLL
jgi:recombinational DNA repair protein RecT